MAQRREKKKRKEKKKDEMKRRRRERGARWQRERLARTKQARKKGTRRVLAPKTEETNEERGYDVVEGTARRQQQFLFSSLLLLERAPPLSHRVQPSPLRGTCTAGPRGAIFRTKRALIRAFIVRVSFLSPPSPLFSHAMREHACVFPHLERNPLLLSCE